MPHYHDPVEYDAQHDIAVVRGTTFSLKPYVIEIRGRGAFVWAAVLRSTPHFRRKSNGGEKTNDTYYYINREGVQTLDPQGHQEETLPAALSED